MEGWFAWYSIPHTKIVLIMLISLAEWVVVLCLVPIRSDVHVDLLAYDLTNMQAS